MFKTYILDGSFEGTLIVNGFNSWAGICTRAIGFPKCDSLVEKID